ncbi:Isochorismatase-like protein [Crepidotus variabilis]|uniref:Isochorismatase-like protein n=1 Tax=Crepidotus variabilis TaxID=179855 RepID=A0A9P6EBL8_9AGAR|nr:Isochorismatase-like protein [Crepidotus variabilis]
MSNVKSFKELIGAPKSTASTKDSVLVVIDAQNEYAEGLLKCEGVETSRKVLASLVEKYRAAGGDIIHVVHQVPDGAPVFTPRTALAEEFAEIVPRSGEKIVVKEHPGSFTGTELEAYLKSTGKAKVVLTGYMAHVCVSTTTRQAAERGWDTLVVEDAIGDRHIPGATADQLVKVVLAELGDAFATIVKASDIE